MNYLLRRQRATALLSQLGLDAVLFIQPENLRYFCGFTGTDGALLLFGNSSIFLTDSRYTEQAGKEVDADAIQEYKNKADGVVNALRDHNVKRVGFEPGLAYSVYDNFRDKSEDACCWQVLKTELDQLRLLKDEQELALIERAVDLNTRAFAEIREMIRPGVVERDIALALEFFQKREGAEEKAFDFIVASGPRGALPHGVASSRYLEAGELVTIDFGCRVEGYHSDETVTLALGVVPDKLRNIHEIVCEAHDLALDAVAPGVPLVELDRIARDHIAASGFGENFGHGLGHGVGLEVHEAPTLSPRATMKAETGMVFTIEPGIYLPGEGGVRIEDMVVVTETGGRTLTKIPKTFRDNLIN